MDDVFVGRQDELSCLHARLADARNGRPRAALIAGVAGVGKTALVGRFVAASGVHCVLSAGGDEHEVALPYGVVQQLILGRQQQPSDALAVLRTRRGPSAEPVQIGSYLADLLGQLQRADPVLVIVDDSQWSDIKSVQALVFALRRMRTERVLALFTIRDDRVEQLPAGLLNLLAGPTGSLLQLSGLNVGGLRALAVALGAAPLSSRAARRLHEHTGGSPLHARALLEDLSASVMQDLSQPLPAPRSYGMHVLARLAACPDDTRHLVMAASVLGQRFTLTNAAQIARLEDPLSALDAAVVAGLLQEVHTATQMQVAFTHPLVRAAVYHDLSPSRRVWFHRQASKVVDDDESQIRHHLAATYGPHRALASKASALAAVHADAGSWTRAADNELAAARVTPASSDRDELVLRAVDHLLTAGEVVEAVALMEEVGAFIKSARRDYVLARLEFAKGHHAESERLLHRAWNNCDATAEPDLVAAVGEQLALHNFLRLRHEPAVSWARRARTMAAESAIECEHSHRVGSHLIDLEAMALALGGRTAEALEATASLAEPTAHAGNGHVDGSIGRGAVHLWIDDPAEASRALADGSSAHLDRRYQSAWTVVALSLRAEAEYRLGNWDDATASGQRAATMAEGADHESLAAMAHAAATFPLAARGQWDLAAQHSTAAAASVTRGPTASNAMWAGMAGALVAHAEDEPQGVADALEPVSQMPDSGLVVEPGIWRWPALFAEALSALGKDRDAERTLGPYEKLSAARGRRSAMMVAARARGVLEAARGANTHAEKAFQAGLTHSRGLSAPFERALLEAAYGRFLRRTRRPSKAVAHLESARVLFCGLEAYPYLERCRHELEACEAGAAPRVGRPHATLTRQELAVCRLVADGRTNRQAAAELVVSVKTIEYHLGNAFAKLAVSSRTQLANRMRQNPV